MSHISVNDRYEGTYEGGIVSGLVVELEFPALGSEAHRKRLHLLWRDDMTARKGGIAQVVDVGEELSAKIGELSHLVSNSRARGRD